MKRNEIDPSLTWDLSYLFSNQLDFESCTAKARQLIEQLANKKGILCDSIDSFCYTMETDEALQGKLENLQVYAQMCNDVDPSSSLVQQNLANSTHLANQALNDLSFMSSELIKNQEKIRCYLKEERCQDYRYVMEEIFRTASHKPDDQTEALLASMTDLFQNPQKVFKSFIPEFKPVLVKGKEEFLNQAAMNQMLHNPDREIRRQAFENFYQQYRQHQNVFSACLIGHSQGQVIQARLRHFDSALQASCFEDDTTPDLFNLVLRMANEKHRDAFHRYNALKKKRMGLDDCTSYDLNVPLVQAKSSSYSLDESFEILQQALSPLGHDYLDLLNKARLDRWIDYMPHVNKRSGAYSWGTYDSVPYILTNFTGGYDSLSTLAHELGHSMHSYLANHAQRPMLAGYRIFVAEVASTVNEVLLNKTLLQNSTDPQEKASLLYNMLEQLVGTLYRQPMFAQFEAWIHSEIEAGHALSSSNLTQAYQQLTQDYYGNAIHVHELEKYKCLCVPHFYYNFYVYKYTIGMSVALCFAGRILKGDNQDYLHFLTLGGSCSPISQLIEAGANPYHEQVYDDAYQFFSDTLDEFENLLDQLEQSKETN